MEILFLCHRIPYPPNKGDKIRSHALLAHLARSHRVHVACFVDDSVDLAYRDEVRNIAGGECLFVQLSKFSKLVGAVKACATGQPVTTSYLYSPTIERWISDLSTRIRIDRTVVFSSGMARYVLQHPRLDPSLAIHDMVDVDSDKWRQYSKSIAGPESWIYRREAALLAQFERAAARQFAATLFVSDYEAQTFAAMAPESAERIFSVPNGVDLTRFSRGAFPNPFPGGELPIVMTGQMDYRPNIDGVEWFSREVLPRLRSDLPGFRFYAVGANPPRSWRNSGYVTAQQVPDVRPYIQHAAAIIAPLRIARGIQNKVLEAMAMEKPIVATHAATRALAVRPGVELMIESEPAKFAAAVADAIGREDLGRNARRYVENHHDWRVNLTILDECLARPVPPEVGHEPIRYDSCGSSVARFTKRAPAAETAN
jgi:sugar transferase (PEP-CTERM/EpsH1 system associated)